MYTGADNNNGGVKKKKNTAANKILDITAVADPGGGPRGSWPPLAL